MQRQSILSHRYDLNCGPTRCVLECNAKSAVEIDTDGAISIAPSVYVRHLVTGVRATKP
jgi:hypothetical protein